MARTYFELDDPDLRDRWFLSGLFDGVGIELDSREFAYGQSVDIGPPIKTKMWKAGTPIDAQPPLKTMLYKKSTGAPLDFTFNTSGVPIVTSQVAKIIAALAGKDIQRIPVQVESRREEYEIINVTSQVACIDTVKSRIQWYKEGNDVRPDLAGKPQMITKLILDPSRIGRHNMFRVKDWTVALIISDLLKDALEESDVTGIKCRPVTAP